MIRSSSSWKLSVLRTRNLRKGRRNLTPKWPGSFWPSSQSTYCAGCHTGSPNWPSSSLHQDTTRWHNADQFNNNSNTHDNICYKFPLPWYAIQFFLYKPNLTHLFRNLSLFWTNLLILIILRAYVITQNRKHGCCSFLNFCLYLKRINY